MDVVAPEKERSYGRVRLESVGEWMPLLVRSSVWIAEFILRASERCVAPSSPMPLLARSSVVRVEFIVRALARCSTMPIRSSEIDTTIDSMSGLPVIR